MTIANRYVLVYYKAPEGKDSCVVCYTSPISTLADIEALKHLIAEQIAYKCYSNEIKIISFQRLEL